MSKLALPPTLNAQGSRSVSGLALSGAKETRGDGRTPVGVYYVYEKRPSNRYDRFLALNYPAAEDAERALHAGTINPDTWADIWLASMRHVAIESGAFVVSAPQYIPASAFPGDFPVDLPQGKEVFGRGGAAIVEPQGGEVIAGPLYDREGIISADCDLRLNLHAKRWFDVVGHYSRDDVLAPAVLERNPPHPDADTVSGEAGGA